MFNPYQDQASGLRRIMSAAKPFVLTVFSALKEDWNTRIIRELALSFSHQGSPIFLIDAWLSPKEVTSDFNAAEVLSLMNTLNETFIEITKTSAILIVNGLLTAQKELLLIGINHSVIAIRMGQRAESENQGYSWIKTLCLGFERKPLGIIICYADNHNVTVVFQNIAKEALNYLPVELYFTGPLHGGVQQNVASTNGKFGDYKSPDSSDSLALNKLLLKLGEIQVNHPSSMLSI